MKINLLLVDGCHDRKYDSIDELDNAHNHLQDLWVNQGTIWHIVPIRFRFLNRHFILRIQFHIGLNITLNLRIFQIQESFEER